MQTYMHASTQRAGVCVQPVQVAVRCGAFEGEAATGLEECFGAWGGENAVELGTFSWTSTNSAVEVGCRGHRKRQAGHEERSQQSTGETGSRRGVLFHGAQGTRLAAACCTGSQTVAILPYTSSQTMRSCLGCRRCVRHCVLRRKVRPKLQESKLDKRACKCQQSRFQLIMAPTPPNASKRSVLVYATRTMNRAMNAAINGTPQLERCANALVA